MPEARARHRGQRGFTSSGWLLKRIAAGVLAVAGVTAPQVAGAYAADGVHGGVGVATAGYLALGDSVPAGYVSPTLPFGPSYVDVAAAQLREQRNCGRGRAVGCSLEVINLSASGDTTGDLIAQQLPTAVALLQERNHNAPAVDDVRLVTVTIGGNDVLTAAALACGPASPQQGCLTALQTALSAVDAAYAIILPALRAAAGPETLIAVTTYYNPFRSCFLSGLAPLADIVLEGGASGISAGLNDIIRARAEQIGAVVVELGGGLLAADDYIGGQDCLHPDASGHQKIGAAVAAAVGDAVVGPPGRRNASWGRGPAT